MEVFILGKIEITIFKDDIIKLKFKYNEDLIRKVKNFKGARWNPEKKEWIIPYFDNYHEKLKKEFNDNENYLLEYMEYGEDSDDKFKKYMENRRYSINSIKSYMYHIEIFLTYFKNRELRDIKECDIMNYMNKEIIKKYSYSYQNQVINAIKLYMKVYGETKVKEELKIERPRTSRKLPNILSKEEILKILSVIKNLKHKTIISFIYSAGLRISEAVNMEIRDIDFNRNIINIKDGKGRKDRQTSLSKKIEQLLKEYMEYYNPSKYLFEGEGGEKYSTRSIQAIFKKALKDAKIIKDATVHTLRHSYATHLHEAGTDIKIIQELLGHESTKTTEIYTHVSKKVIQNVKSPFDEL